MRDFRTGMEEIKDGCHNCLNHVGYLGSPNSDRIICKLHSLLDGWPHWSYQCESWEKDIRPEGYTTEKNNSILPCDTIERKI